MWTKENYEEMKSALFERSSHDLEFRKLCLENPNAAVEEISGMKLPEGKELNFLENTETKGNFVLPEFEDPSRELNENELKSVAGAGNFFLWGIW